MASTTRVASRIADAMRAVPRDHFLPPAQRPFARLDEPLPIGWGATNSQPSTVAYMLRLLDVRPGSRVLDVGSGSGWTTELLAHLVGPAGLVVGVEIVPELVEFGRLRLSSPWARISPATPGVRGLPDLAPWDRILVSADPGRIPEELVAQLAVGGRMVLPAAGIMWIVTCTPAGPARHQAPGRFSFVPLR